MAKQALDNETLSSGVDALIAKLRDEGVSAGREESDRIVGDARAEAKQVLDKAEAEARDRLETARKEADAYRAAGESALKTAMRDTVLDMKSTLMERFSSDVKRLVSLQLTDPDVLKRMILELAGRVGQDPDLGDAKDVEFVLPETVVGLDDLRSNPEELRKGPLTTFVFGLTAEMLREGVTFSGSDDMAAGIRIYMKDKDITLDLTEEAVADLLLQHLQPRFRAILEGIVK
ncbi:MAG: V-type ATP synthase subunit E family protein [Hyphomicrobiales bacterium]